MQISHVSNGMARRFATAIISIILAWLCLAINVRSTKAAEDSKQFYLLGTRGPMAGGTPPPGTYITSHKYGYSGSATATTANSVVLDQVGKIDTRTDIAMDVDYFFEIPHLLWVPDRQILGGNLGLGIFVPVGWVDVSVDITALQTLTLLDGTTLQRGGTLGIRDDTIDFGDPILQAMLGWKEGNWHWNLVGLLNVPIGAFDKDDVANMGLHRWAFDISGALTWFDAERGYEASVVVGYSFNGENHDTNYRSGNEFHAELALMKHFSKNFAVGFTGFHLQQVTGDSGAGAVLGPFKGHVNGIGPALNFNFNLGRLPVMTELRWYHEMDAKHRPEGDIGFFKATIPLGGGHNIRPDINTDRAPTS